MTKIERRRSRLAAIAIATLLAPGAAEAAEETIRAFSLASGTGAVIMTGENQATFTGVFKGRFYVDTEHGPIPTGVMTCPAVVTIALDTGKQEGKARCNYAADDGANLFATFECSGVHLIGCDGPFTITGGTGRFAGAAGGGPAVVRGDFRVITAELGKPVEETVSGIFYWPELRYTLP